PHTVGHEPLSCYVLKERAEPGRKQSGRVQLAYQSCGGHLSSPLTVVWPSDPCPVWSVCESSSPSCLLPPGLKIMSAAHPSSSDFHLRFCSARSARNSIFFWKPSRGRGS